MMHRCPERKKFFRQTLRADQNGAVLVLVAILAVVLIGITALAIDIGHLLVVRNELQNAADAGALAGAQALYEDPDGPGELLPGDEVNTGANQVAFDTAILNLSEKIAVEVNSPLTNADDVQRGHWNFATRTFTRSDVTEAVGFFGVTEADLDQMDGNYEYPPGTGELPVFVNAVKVVARRQAQPAHSFFAKIFGYQDFGLNAEAVGYVGFAGGRIGPGEADQPLVICNTSITDIDGKLTCNIGRRINSGSDPNSYNTAGWTDFTQPSACSSGTNTNAVRPLVCGEGNPTEINTGLSISASGGEITPAFNKMRDCWLTNSNNGTAPWEMTLIAVDCIHRNVGNCPTVVGAVSVNLVWMTDINTPMPDRPGDVPTTMASPSTELLPDWDGADSAQCGVFQEEVGNSTEAALASFRSKAEMGLLPAGFDDAERWQGESVYTAGMARWDCFVNHFQLKNVDDPEAPPGTPAQWAPLEFKSMYFLPDCERNSPTGDTGGPNFGVLAKRPVLVD